MDKFGIFDGKTAEKGDVPSDNEGDVRSKFFFENFFDKK